MPTCRDWLGTFCQVLFRQNAIRLCCGFQGAEVISLILFYPGKVGDSWFPLSGQRLQLWGFSRVSSGPL